jgi:hypothetical protein
MAAAGSPLTKEQKSYLAQLLIAERDRIPQPSTQQAITTTADIDREAEWMADQHRRVREAAASMLSPARTLAGINRLLGTCAVSLRHESQPHHVVRVLQ